MYECLVGYTPFYADEPVQTCKKILRWQNYLEVPMEIESKLSPECLSFMLMLLSDSSRRIGTIRRYVHCMYSSKKIGD
jgi:serine/threonine kinase 38